MNLQDEVTAVRVALSEPFRTDETKSFITDIEILDWIRQGELQVTRDLVDDALYTIQTEATLTPATAGVALPVDFLRALTVQVQVRAGGPFVEADLIGVKQARNVQTDSQWRAGNVRPMVYFFQNKLYVLPDTSPSCVLRYVKRPTKRYKYFTGASSVASNSTIRSSAMAQFVADYWAGCEVSLQSGTTKGETRPCSTSDTSTPPIITVSTVFSITNPIGTVFNIGEKPSLPEELYPLWLNWAAYLGFSKDREDGQASIKLAIYKEMRDQTNGRYKGLLRQEPNVEMPR